VGWDRLEQILDEYPNVYIDTSIGCFVRWGDVMYPEDQKKLRDFFIKYSDRIVFGTDIEVGEGAHQETYRLSLMGHMLFIRQLRLPYDELQKVSHQNAEKLFQLGEASDVRMGTIRP
jgi:predicted TIM-barrel fold metal-dependent hydrolase